MRLVALHDNAMIADVVSEKESIYIGSDPACRLVLEHPDVTPRHAVVYPDQEGNWQIQVLDANAPLQLNDEVLSETTQLRENDALRIGDFLVRAFPEYTERPGARVALGVSKEQLERFAKTTLPPGTVLRRLEEPLTLQPNQLASVARAAVGLSGTAVIEDCMDTALQSLLENFGAQRAWLGIRRTAAGRLEYVEGRLLTGQPTDLPEIGETLKTRVLDRAQFALVPRVSRDERFSVLSGPLLGPNGSLGMAYLDSGLSGRRYEERDLDFFVVQLHALGAQLDAIFRGQARTRAAMADGQVTLTHEVQTRLTPRKLPQWDQLQCSAFREPGRRHSGDIYDVLKLANNLAAFLVVHTPVGGALAPLLMSQAQTSFRVAVMHQDTPAVFMRTLNWMLYDGQDDHPLHCFAGVVDPKTGQMRYTIAGDMGAFVIGKRGEARSLAPEQPLPPVSAARSTVYPLLPEQLRTADSLAVFSRGITTATNEAGDTFGQERTLNLLCDGFGQSAGSMMKEVVTDLEAFTAGVAQPEDITIVLAHRL